MHELKRAIDELLEHYNDPDMDRSYLHYLVGLLEKVYKPIKDSL